MTLCPVRRQRRKDARPHELLDAALSLFVEKGFAATRSEEVARRAGVSKGTLYLYYPSKEELFKAVVRQSLTPIIARGADIVGSFTGSTPELLVRLMTTWWNSVGNTRASGIFKLILAEACNFPDLTQFYVNEVVIPTRQLLVRALQRGIDRGEFRPLNVDEVAHALIAPVQYLVLHQHSIGACGFHDVDLSPQSFMSTQIDMLLYGMMRPEATRQLDVPALLAPLTHLAPP
ncbi:TetR/AcrR family transcriptional regulator [Aquabacterium sp.]|uniref:TetR/AcrR family transcriptional regulator n=1 Tax=Aquabacterium sp. TaxID=1872578 RepID=UPI0035AE493A